MAYSVHLSRMALQVIRTVQAHSRRTFRLAFLLTAKFAEQILAFRLTVHIFFRALFHSLFCRRAMKAGPKLASSPLLCTRDCQPGNQNVGENALMEISNKVKEKRVSFKVDADNEVTVDINTYDKSAGDTSAMYWSDDELREIQRHAKTEGSKFVLRNTEAAKGLDDAFNECCGEKFTGQRQTRKLLLPWVLSDVRGLEDVALLRFYKERVEASSQIIEYQNNLREDCAYGRAFDEKLRSFCKKVSSPSKRFAYEVGRADAFVSLSRQKKRDCV